MHKFTEQFREIPIDLNVVESCCMNTHLEKLFYILLDTIDKDLSCSSDIQTGKRSTRKRKKSEELEIPMGFLKNEKE